MTSKLTREELLNIIETDHVQCGEASALARMALAAMDGEPVAWTWHYREQWHVTNDERRASFVAKDGDVAVLPLYRHAQSAQISEPVLPLQDKDLQGVIDALEHPAGINAAGKQVVRHALVEIQERRKADREPVAEVVSIYGDPEAFGEREIRPLVGIQQMPYGTKLYRHAQPAPVVSEEMTIRDACKFVQDMRLFDDVSVIVMRTWNACRAAMLQAGNSPVIPDGYVMVPMRLTAENGAKGALSGEFSETKFVNCPECFGDDECETCDGSGRIEITVPVTWTTIKEIWAKGVEHFAAAPQSPGGDHATVPGKWIPVSERMPESNKFVLVSNGVWVGQGLYDDSEHLESDEHWQDEHREFINVLHHPVTHWMPLPAAPQEPKP